MLNQIFKIILFVVFLTSCNSDVPYSYRIEKTKILKISIIPRLSFIDDLNNNFNSELIAVYKGDSHSKNYKYKIQITDLFYSNRSHLDSENIWDELKDVKAHDFTNDGRKEIIYIYERNDSLFLKCYDLFSDKKKKYLLDKYFLSVKKLDVDEYWKGTGTIWEFNDLNHDGYDDVLINVHANYEKLPRGVIAYDVHNKKELWYFPTGTVIAKIEVADLNHDGINEILLSTGAPGNGAVNNGTDDFHSYFLVIDKTRKLIFKKEMGGENSSTNIKYDFFTSELNKDLISITSSGNYYTEGNNPLVIWGWDKNLKFYLQKENNRLSLTNNYEILPYRGSPHIFVTTKTEKMCIINSILKVVDTLGKDNNFTSYIGSYDLDQDGVVEYLLCENDTETAVFNSDFELICTMPRVFKLFEIEKGRDQANGFAVIGLNGTISEISLSKIPLTQKFLTKPWEKIIAGLIIANLLFIFFLYYKSGNWNWYRDQLKYFENSAFAVFVLDSNGKVVTCNKKGEEILNLSLDKITNYFAPNLFEKMHYEIAQWIGNCLNEKQNSKSTFKIRSNEVEQTLEIHLQFIFSRLGRKEGVLLVMNDITPILQSKKAAAWLTIAQKLAHEIKNPLTTIRLSLQRIQMEYENKPELKENLEELIEDSLNEATRVRKVVDDFMRFSKTETDNPRSINIKELIQDIVNKYLLTMPNKIEIKTEIDKNLPAITVIESQIYSAFSNIMDNAIESIHQKGSILIKMGMAEIFENKSVFGIREYVVIEISDTGCGMDKAVLDKIFQPFYTTKEGGSGLGLIIVNKIVEDHGGTIEIFSKKDLGTNVTIKLPVNHFNSTNTKIG